MNRKLLLNALITSHFSHAPVLWMFHNRGLKNRINHIDETALRLVYRDCLSLFDERLLQENLFDLHQRILKKFVTEILKTQLSIEPEVMRSIIQVIGKPF